MTRYCYRLSGWANNRRAGRRRVTVERVTSALDTRAAEAWLRVALARLRAEADGSSFRWFLFHDTDAEGFIVRPEASL